MSPKERSATGAEPKKSSLSWAYLLATLGIGIGTFVPKDWLAHKVLMSFGMAMFALACRCSPYFLPMLLVAFLFPLIEFNLIGKRIALVGLSLSLLLALFTWLREKKDKREQAHASGENLPR